MRGRLRIPWDDNTVIPSRKPGIGAIHWLAGFYEGQGNCNCYRDDIRVVINYSEPEVLQWCRDVFGGTLGSYGCTEPKQVNQWRINGARALGVMYTIYTLISKRKKNQFRQALAQAITNSTLSSHGISPEALKRLLTS